MEAVTSSPSQAGSTASPEPKGITPEASNSEKKPAFSVQKVGMASSGYNNKRVQSVVVHSLNDDFMGAEQEGAIEEEKSSEGLSSSNLSNSMQEDKMVALHVTLTKNQADDVDAYAEDLEQHQGGKIQFDFENEMALEAEKVEAVTEFVAKLADLKVSFFKARFTMVRGLTLQKGELENDDRHF